MTIAEKIKNELSINNTLIITGNHVAALNAMDDMVDGYGRTLDNGTVLYSFGNKRVFVGEMPPHPVLQTAATLTV